MISLKEALRENKAIRETKLILCITLLTVAEMEWIPIRESFFGSKSV